MAILFVENLFTNRITTSEQHIISDSWYNMTSRRCQGLEKGPKEFKVAVTTCHLQILKFFNIHFFNLIFFIHQNNITQYNSAILN